MCVCVCMCVGGEGGSQMDSSTAEKCGAYGVVVRDGGALTAADSTLRHNAKAGLLARGGRSSSQVPCHVGGYVGEARDARLVAVCANHSLQFICCPNHWLQITDYARERRSDYRSFAVQITGYKSLITAHLLGRTRERGPARLGFRKGRISPCKGFGRTH